MRKLTKGLKPTILATHEETWTKEYLAALGNSDPPSEALKTRYRHKEIKKGILEETFGKCAYCESKITHIFPGDTEHILPTSKYPEKIFTWENLTLACRECNHKKLDYASEEEPLIHPYLDNPEDHLRFYGPLAVHAVGSTKGFLTKETLKLNRPDLLERRKERIERILPLIDLWASSQGDAMKAAVKSQIVAECGDDKEFSVMIRTFIQHQCGLGFAN